MIKLLFLFCFKKSIEFFLAKEVTHFVTDKLTDRDPKALIAASPLSQQQTPSTPKTPQTNTSNYLGDFNDIAASPSGSPYDARVS